MHLIFYLLASAGGFYFGFSALKKKRLIENTPTSKIRSAAMGLTEIKGTAQTSKPVKSPLTGIECCYYSYTVDKRVKSRNSHRWKTILSGNSSVFLFTVKDETGGITVDPNILELHMEPKFTHSGATWNNYCERLLESSGIRTKWFVFNSYLRFTEYRVDINENIYILGTVEQYMSAACNYRQRLNDYIKSIKINPERMKEFDTNSDGEISADEWEEAQKRIETEFLQKQADADSEPAQNSVIIKKGQNNRIFILSNRSEKELCSKYAITAFLGFLISGIFFLVLIAVLTKLC